MKSPKPTMEELWTKVKANSSFVPVELRSIAQALIAEEAALEPRTERIGRESESVFREIGDEVKPSEFKAKYQILKQYVFDQIDLIKEVMAFNQKKVDFLIELERFHLTKSKEDGLSQLDTLRAQNKDLMAENLQFQGMLENATRAKRDLQRRAGEVDELEEKYKTEFEAALSDLRGRLDTAQMQAGAARSAIAGYEAQRDKARADQAAAEKKAAEEIEREMALARAAEARVAELEAASSTAQAEAQAVRQAEAEAKASAAAAQEQAAGLTAQLEAARGEVTAATAQADDAAAAVEAAQAATEVAAQRVGEIEDQLASTERRAAEANARAEQLQSEVDLLTGEMEALQQYHIRALKNARAETAVALEQATETNRRAEELQAQVDQLQMAVKVRQGELRAAHQERDAATARAEELQDELDILRGDMRAAAENYARNLAVAQDETEQQRAQVRYLGEENHALQEQLAASRAAAAVARAAAEQAIARADAAEAVEREIVALPPAPVELVDDEAAAARQEELEALRRKNAGLQAELVAQADLVDQNEALRRRNAELLERLAAAEAQVIPQPQLGPVAKSTDLSSSNRSAIPTAQAAVQPKFWSGAVKQNQMFWIGSLAGGGALTYGLVLAAPVMLGVGIGGLLFAVVSVPVISRSKTKNWLKHTNRASDQLKPLRGRKVGSKPAETAPGFGASKPAAASVRPKQSGLGSVPGGRC